MTERRNRAGGPGVSTALAMGAVAAVAAGLAVGILLTGVYRLAAAGALLGLAAVAACVWAGRLQRAATTLRDGLDHIRRGHQDVSVPDSGWGLGCVGHGINELARHLQDDRSRTAAREMAMVMTLGQAAEGRSHHSANHMQRVGAMAGELGRLAGLPDDEVGLLRQAAPLHDLGKVGVPDSVLNKPGKFTPREFSVMKVHAELGHRILAGSRQPVLQAAAVIALAHHERWDGYGYPQGLSGEDIPLHGRIVGLVDAFDAMFSVRNYREAMPLDQGLGIIRSQRGHHFDPALTDLFLAHLPTFMAIMEQYKDDRASGDGRPGPADPAGAEPEGCLTT
jgi:hypothetical protein